MAAHPLCQDIVAVSWQKRNLKREFASMRGSCPHEVIPTRRNGSNRLDGGRIGGMRDGPRNDCDLRFLVETRRELQGEGRRIGERGLERGRSFQISMVVSKLWEWSQKTEFVEEQWPQSRGCGAVRCFQVTSRFSSQVEWSDLKRRRRERKDREDRW